MMPHPLITNASPLRTPEREANPRSLLPPQLAAQLTPNERIIMQALLCGQDLTAIAWKLKRDMRTISSHKQRAMGKLALTSNAMLYALAALLSPPLPTSITEQRQLLTLREQQVLNALLDGHGVTGIAHLQGRSVKTVSFQKRLLMQKLGVTNEVELFALAPLRARALLANWPGWTEFNEQA
ncbi:LuxR C-terminal-related transcriptional regulator [Serratia proteamaculans]|uniref:LuxR C-terminal-related transcriptional regulator n=1 Tax=Serratia proteamaculans TaxID=28151 RepID=UPI0039AEC1B1